MAFIEEHVKNYPINKVFLSEMHKMIVDGLQPPPHGEGDATPGQYRRTNLKINKSAHKPPERVRVGDYMNEMIDFVNREDSPKYDLLKAVLHLTGLFGFTHLAMKMEERFACSLMPCLLSPDSM
jgi:Fic family protein